MGTVKHVVKIFFDNDRPTLKLSEDWITNRFYLFTNTTLQSLLNQTFQDFEIWMFCGKRNQQLVDSFDWHPRCKIIRDHGKKELSKLNTDYLAITRLDSDDLFHQDAMKEINDNLIFSDKRECLIFRQGFLFDWQNGILAKYRDERSPFFTHIFPKNIYKDFDLFNEQHNLKHGLASKGATELKKYMVCVMKHEVNISDIRRNITPPEKNRHNYVELTKKHQPYVYVGEVISDNKIKIGNVLQEFGI